MHWDIKISDFEDLKNEWTHLSKVLTKENSKEKLGIKHFLAKNGLVDTDVMITKLHDTFQVFYTLCVQM